MKATLAVLAASVLALGAGPSAWGSGWYPTLAPGFEARLLASGLDGPSPCAQGMGDLDGLYVGIADGQILSVETSGLSTLATLPGVPQGLAVREGPTDSLYAVVEIAAPAIVRIDAGGTQTAVLAFSSDVAVENGIAAGPGGGSAFGTDLYLARFVDDGGTTLEGRITRFDPDVASPVPEDIVVLSGSPPLGLAFGPPPDGAPAAAVAEGTVLYVAEQSANRVRYVYPDSGGYASETFFVGDALFGPRTLAMSPGGAFGEEALYAGDFFVDRVFRFPLSGGAPELLAAFPAAFNVRDLCFTDTGTLVVTGSQAGVVVEIYPVIPEPGLASLTGLLLALSARRRRIGA